MSVYYSSLNCYFYDPFHFKESKSISSISLTLISKRAVNHVKASSYCKTGSFVLIPINKVARFFDIALLCKVKPLFEDIHPLRSRLPLTFCDAHLTQRLTLFFIEELAICK